MRQLLLLAALACSPPRVEDIGRVSDGGSCRVLVAPGACDDAPGIERSLESGLPCNTCVVYLCECSRRIFCKLCSPGADRGADAWGCTGGDAWCGDL